MSVTGAILFAILFPAAFLLALVAAYQLGSLPKRGEFSALQSEVSELRKEIREAKSMTVRNR